LDTLELARRYPSLTLKKNSQILDPKSNNIRLLLNTNSYKKN